MAQNTGKRGTPKISLLDALLASHGLALIPGITARAVSVGTALLRHLNRWDHRCDPGIQTLMRGTRLSRSTVLRALDELCNGPDPLFFRRVHGGRNHTNSYAPNWTRLKKSVTDFEIRAGIKKISDEQSQHVKPGSNQHVTPTRSHPVKPKPIEETSINNQAAFGRFGKAMSRSNATQSSASRREAMTQSAHRRLSEAVQKVEHPEKLYMVDDIHPGSWQEAVAQEAVRPGTGILLLQSRASGQ